MYILPFDTTQGDEAATVADKSVSVTGCGLTQHPSPRVGEMLSILPAMSAVWEPVNRKVIAVYIAFSLVGAGVLGYIYNFILWVDASKT